MGLKLVYRAAQGGGVAWVVAIALLWLPWAGARADDTAAVRELIAEAALGDTHAAVLVRDLTDERILVAIDPDAAMVPASNMKLVTTAAALARLGADFTFTTRLQLVDAPPRLAQGDEVGDADVSRTTRGLPSLAIRGDGDPAFADPTLLSQAGFEDVDAFLDLWVEAVLDTGIDHFDALLIDDRVFDQQFVHPDWPRYDLPRRWCAQVAGINFYNNVIDVRPIPTEPGEKARLEIYPYRPSLEILNRVRTGKPDVFKPDRRLGTNRFIFGGTVYHQRSSPFQVTVHDPSMFFGQYFRYMLEEQGVSVDAVGRVEEGASLSDARTLHTVHTTLAGVIARTNQDSQNLYAEALLKRMGHDLTGSPGSFENGAAAVDFFFEQTLDDSMGLSEIQVADGSGMSRNNRMTPRAFIALLEYMYEHETLGPPFTASLARAGHSGTLRHRMDDLSGAVYGKSGYLGRSANYASALSGYLVCPAGPHEEPRIIAFSLMFNGFQPPLSNRVLKDLQDRIVGYFDKKYSLAAVDLEQ